MSQPKNRRRSARRRAQAYWAAHCRDGAYVHVMVSGALRNPIGKVSSLDRAITVGFGYALVRRDGEVFCDGEHVKRRSLLARQRCGKDVYPVVTLRKVEKWIKRHGAGGSRWTASIRAPLWDATWERQRVGKWVCVEAGMGFA